MGCDRDQPEGKGVSRALLTGALLLVAVAAGAEDFRDPVDPWETYNRAMYRFNDGFDRVLLRPLARGYETVTPRIVRTSIGNVFDNLDDVDNAVNNALQGKPGAALSDLGRLLINSTLGVGGLLDVATEVGLEKHDESVGQTLSVWGLPAGPYFVIPFMGPSTVTDALGRPIGSRIDPLRYYHPVDHRNVMLGVRLIDLRAGLLRTESLITGDEYLFVRDAYLQRREFLVNDGEVYDSFGDDF